MKSYLVGGAVRDALLGQPAGDCDWVVVGADPAHMKSLGFKPVGRDFPVFLHPKTGEEFALARTERKTATATAALSSTLTQLSRLNKICNAVTSPLMRSHVTKPIAH